MSRLAAVFETCRTESRAALIGYLPTGYPTVDTSIEAMTALVESGCDIVEGGVAYSDPGMDGPTIARATETALANGVRVYDALRVDRDAPARLPEAVGLGEEGADDDPDDRPEDDVGEGAALTGADELEVSVVADRHDGCGDPSCEPAEGAVAAVSCEVAAVDLGLVARDHVAPGDPGDLLLARPGEEDDEEDDDADGEQGDDDPERCDGTHGCSSCLTYWHSTMCQWQAQAPSPRTSRRSSQPPARRS